MAAGIGCGIACGISSGRSQARKELEANLGELQAAGRIKITDAEGRLITVEALLCDALSPQGMEKTRVVVIVSLVLGVLMLAGLLAFYLISR